jgi:hypothetical protein
MPPAEDIRDYSEILLLFHNVQAAIKQPLHLAL